MTTVRTSPTRISADDALRRVTSAARPGHGLDESGRFIAIGRERLAIHDVTSYRLAGQETKDFASSFATAGLFGSGAMLFVVAVADFQWRTRFVGGAVLLGLIALFALIDLGRARWHRTYTFDLSLRDGSRRHFVTADQAIAERLRDALDAAGATTATTSA